MTAILNCTIYAYDTTLNKETKNSKAVMNFKKFIKVLIQHF